VTDKLDDFFSPERLRGKWTTAKKNEKKVPESRSLVLPDKHETLYSNIRTMIVTRFSGEPRKILEELMDGLKAHLDMRFANTSGKAIIDEDIFAMNMAIDRESAQIEDIIEAFEMKGNKP